MKLYLDTEFNGHGGSLLSLAICRPDANDTWYGVWMVSSDTIVPWVAEHVVPHLDAYHPERGPDDFLRASLHGYLKYIDDGDMHVYADWPADFEHFTRLLCGPSYDKSLYLPCTMHMLVTPPGEPKPEMPHNALSDAMALMKWHQSISAEKAIA